MSQNTALFQNLVLSILTDLIEQKMKINLVDTCLVEYLFLHHCCITKLTKEEVFEKVTI